MNECTFVILGATGDLSKRKLIPALYNLIKEKKITKFTIIGTARTKTTIDKVLENSKPFIPTIDKAIWKTLSKHSSYLAIDFYNPDDYKILKKAIEQAEKKHKLSGNRIFYLATLPEHFETITSNLSRNKMVNKPQPAGKSSKKKPWSRVVYEKPFGHNLKSARKINRCITSLFDESQIYRIDHFLWEELIGNIALIRFANLFFQPLWNNKYIESVQIILNEKLGIEGRGAFYEKYGALKDVVQNHMLQMLALIAMEPPKKLSGEHIRSAKAHVLKKVSCDDALLGQYKGYHDETGVKPDSTTETFAALALTINTKRWKGVPFFLKTGKYLEKKETSIHIKFKKPAYVQEELESDHNKIKHNYLSIQIQPREGFFLEVNAKHPGIMYGITPAKMDFCHSCIFGPNTPEAYETLLHDVLIGDQSIFVRFDEIEYSWKLIDKILEKKHTIHTYEKASAGPKKTTGFL